MPITRRQFLATSATATGALVVSNWSGLLHGIGPAKAPESAPGPVKEQIFRSANNPECNHCAFQVHVRNGRVVRLGPDPNFYIKPCLRGYSRLQYTYSPDRLKYPMKRVGARGEGKWQRISWDEALDTVAKKLAEIRDQYGPETVYFQGGAILSVIPGYIRGRFANAYGQGVTTGTTGGLCCNAMSEGSNPTIGYRINQMENWPNAKLMINWGHNPAVTYIPHWRLMNQGRDNGMKMITIDPRYSETASKSDQWISIKPGTDSALAAGMIKVILDEKLYDEAFVMKKTNLPFLVNAKTNKLLLESDVKSGGDKAVFQVWDKATNGPAKPEDAKEPVLEGTFDLNGTPLKTVWIELKEMVAKYPAEKVEQITGVPAATALSLARLFARTKPAMINANMSGSQRVPNGVYLTALWIYLSALTGNLGVSGGGLCDVGGTSVGTSQNVASPYPGKTKGSLHATSVATELDQGIPYKIHAMYFGGGSPGQKPNSGLLMKVLKEKIDFIVVQDILMTDAATVADIILPSAHIFEKFDFIVPIRNYYYQLMDKAIEPLWESKSDVWIFTELAKRLGFGDKFTMTDEEYINAALKPTGLSVESLRQSGPVWAFSDPKLNRFKVKWDKPPFYYFKDTPFETPSKRVEFHAAKWEAANLPPMADYIHKPHESPEETPDLAKKYPLSLVNGKMRKTVHTMFGSMQWMNEIFPEAWVDIHEVDAAARGIKDGDTVQVLNDRGTITVKAHVHVGIRPGVVSVQNGWWMQQGGNASVLSNDKWSPIAFGHALNTTLVEVRKAGGKQNG